MTNKAFKINGNYEMFSPCDQTCTWAYKVLNRTAKTVTLAALDDNSKVVKCRIACDTDGQEFCRPLGRYSMSPVLRAR